jgi:hypothetical protein
MPKTTSRPQPAPAPRVDLPTVSAGGPPPAPTGRKANATSPRYATGTEALSARILAARDRVGRKTLAAHLGITEGACWRWERNKIHPAELAAASRKTDSLDQLTSTKAVSRTKRIDQAIDLISAKGADIGPDLQARLLDLLDV